MKRIFLFLFSSILFIPPATFSQAPITFPDIEWEKTYGGSKEDFGRGIYNLPDGTFLIYGGSRSFDGDVSFMHDYAGDAWLVNIDTNGILLWEKSYVGNDWDGLGSLHPTPDGGYAMVGDTWGAGGDVSGYHYGGDDLPDGWFVKFDSTFNIEWNKALGSSNWETLSDFAVVDDGYIVVGEYGGYYSDSEVEIYKIDATGEIIWDKYIGGSDYDYPGQILALPDGGFLISASTYSNNYDVSGNHGEMDGWVVKINSEGEIEWQKCLGGSNNDALSRFQKTPDNGYIFLGSSMSSDGDLTENKGITDIWVIKTDSMANIEWQRSMGGSSWDYTGSVSLLDKGYLITGHTSSIDGDVTDNFYAGSSAMWIVKLGIDGSIEWTHCYGGTGFDASDDILITDNGYYSIGPTTSNDGDITFNHGSFDYWLVKLKKECEHIHYFTDNDGDGYGDILTDTLSCTPLPGYITDETDCADSNFLIHPFTEDICNSVDDNCNGALDEDALFTNYYIDSDLDGYGDAFIDSISCSIIVGYITDSTDCNDGNINIYPGAMELCNFIDDDCNFLVDDGFIYVHGFEDGDTDGFGNLFIDTIACELPFGFVIDSTDCNDTNADIYSGATELCNYIDDDCNLIIDDGFIYVHGFEDADADGFGNLLIDTIACDIPFGFVIDSTDCNDMNSAVFPGAAEVENGIDDNCDGVIDEYLFVNNQAEMNITIYPNPVTDVLFIDCSNHNYYTLKIRNIMNQNFMAESYFNTSAFINVKDLSPGLYFVEFFNADQKVADRYFIKL